MKNILIIGGTRNMGYSLSKRLHEAGYNVTILNRGMTRDDLPDTIHRLKADRTDPQQMRRALLAKTFDVIVDFVMFSGEEAQTMIDLMKDQIGHYILISSGQVYLVRENIERPFQEEEYEGRLQPQPKANTFSYEEWLYGMRKRECEDALFEAYEAQQFPVSTLRLPMVNSQRDPFDRLYSYYVRLKDGGPILIPETPAYPLRHVYGEDVVDIIQHMIETGKGIGRAYNLSQDETVSIDEFLNLLARTMEKEAHLVRVKRSVLEANGFVPYCSPFSERWMSELTNERSKAELDATYTPLADYLGVLVAHYAGQKLRQPTGYKRRPAEIRMAEEALHEN